MTHTTFIPRNWSSCWILFLLCSCCTLSAPLSAELISTGDVTPSDLSTWRNSTLGYVGGTSNGSLLVTNSSMLRSRRGYIGYQADTSALVSVEGTGSSWTVIDSLSIGSHGNGNLLIRDGGFVVSVESGLGSARGSRGSASVIGAGSTWEAGRLFFASDGFGSLSITDGGVVHCESPYLSLFPASVSRAYVSDPGSQWNINGNVLFALLGDAHLTITNRALVRINGNLSISPSSNDSYINMSDQGMLALAGKADGSIEQFLDLINGTDDIRYWDQATTTWAPIAEAVQNRDYTLRYIHQGELAGYTMLTVGPVPEPASVLLAILGFAGVGCLASRRATR